MKKTLLTLMCLATMMVAGVGLKAQEVTITLLPGWTWISYPRADTLDIATALGTFTPMEGDMIKTQYGFSNYHDGYWNGSVQHFYPGMGYMYYSTRIVPIIIVFGASTPQVPVVVTTLEPTDITMNSAICGGNVASSNGNYVSVTLRGICWGTNPNPTFNDNYIEAGNGFGSFTVSMTELTPFTTYYVRAFAVTPTGTFYGDEVSVYTQIWSNGILPGAFSVSANQQVYFSQGNLQYQASTNTWKFADNQYDCIGNANSNISSFYSGWIDLFGWGTSGYHDANDPYNVNYQPWSTSTSQLNSSYNYYGYGPSTNMTDPSLTGTSANYDWGVYNPISNGGNQTNQWRSLTINQWTYVFFSRTTTSGIRYAKANVNNVNGIILLPDDWSSSTYSLNSTNSGEASFSSNTLTASQWSNLEQAGAVFLPAAGYRSGTSVYNVGSYGNYWSASCHNIYFAFDVWFIDSYLDMTYYGNSRCNGLSVRLVCVAEN